MGKFSEQATSALPQTVGNATVFEDKKPSALDHLQNAWKYRDEQAAKQKAARDKDIADKLKYAPEAIWHPFTEEHNQGVTDLLNHRAEMINRGSSTEYNGTDYRDFENKKFGLQQNVSKAEDIKKNYFDIINNKTPYTNQNVVFSKTNDYVMGADGKRKKISEIEVNSMYDVFNDPETLNPAELTQDFVKTIPEKVNQIVQQKAINVGADRGVYFDEINEKSKFYTTGADGKPVLNITPETKAMFYAMDARTPAYVQMEMKKNDMSEDEVISKLISPYAYVNKTVNRSGITKESEGGKDDETDVTHLFDTEENYNLNAKGGSDKKVTKSHSPHEIRIGQKETDAPLLVNAKKYIDPTTNTFYKDGDGQPLVGERKVTISRLRLLPYDETTGQHLPGSKEEIETYKKNHPKNTVGLKWFGVGIMHDSEDGEKVDKQVMIPYEDVKIDLEKKKKINLDARPASEYSDAELKYFIKTQFSGLTAEQKAQKFIELRKK